METRSLKEVLLQARARKRAVGAFNIWNLESIPAIAAAAEELQQPAILMVGRWLFRDFHPGDLQAVTEAVRRRASVPLFLHLDHGRSIEDVMIGIRYGCDSVMIDGSSLPLEKNIELTKCVVDLAQPLGVQVEAELGHVGRASDTVEDGGDTSHLTIPEEVSRFVEETGVDLLAVAIGTAHGIYKQEPHLDIERLKAIRQATDTPLVLHGGSATPDDQLRAAIEEGACKINIGTELAAAFTSSLRELVTSKDKLSAISIVPSACQAITEGVRQRIALFSGLEL